MPNVAAGFNRFDGAIPGFIRTVGFERNCNEADFALAVVVAHEPEAVRIFNPTGATRNGRYKVSTLRQSRDI